MGDIPALFAASLDVALRKPAELQLETLSIQQGFLPYVLQIVLDQSKPLAVRQAPCLFVKKQIRRRWGNVSFLPIKFTYISFSIIDDIISPSIRSQDGNATPTH